MTTIRFFVLMVLLCGPWLLLLGVLPMSEDRRRGAGLAMILWSALLSLAFVGLLS